MRQPCHRFLCLFALSLFIAAATPARAQDPPSVPVRWEIGLFGGILDDRPEFEPDETRFRLAHEGLFGIRAAHHFASGFFLGGDLLYSPMEVAVTGLGSSSHQNLKAVIGDASVGYRFGLVPQVHLIGRAGAGLVRWDAGAEDEIDFAFNLGAGVGYFIAPRVAVRTDVRLHFLPSALATTRRALNPDRGAAGEILWLLGLNGGLSVYLGRN